MVDPAASGASRIKWRRNPHLKNTSSGVQRPRDDLCQVMALQKLAWKKRKKKEEKRKKEHSFLSLYRRGRHLATSQYDFVNDSRSLFIHVHVRLSSNATQSSPLQSISLPRKLSLRRNSSSAEMGPPRQLVLLKLILLGNWSSAEIDPPT